MKTKTKDFILINLGLILVAFGIVLFRTPNKFALGGVSGLALILDSVFPSIGMGLMMAAINTTFLLIGFFLLGKDFIVKTLYGSYAVTFFIFIIEKLIPITEPLTSQTFLELLYAVFLPGIGSAIVFNCGTTTGGTDILAKIVCKYFPNIKISYSLLIIDFSIALSSGLFFGIEALLFSITGVIIKSFVVDLVLENLNVNKVVVVISSHPNDVKDFICNKLVRGATIHNARGAYNLDSKEVITTVLNRKQAMQLQSFVKNIDPSAFITITNSSKIVGKGFARYTS